MPVIPGQAERFVSAVHWRLVIARAAEGGGAGLLLACAPALALVLVALWLGRDAAAVAGAFLAVGAVMGLAWGVLHRPTRVDAAIEADRQLRLAELLSTMLTLSAKCDADPWAMSVRAAADSACAGFRPGDVVIGRYGVRGWGGIGLSAALVLTLGAMTGLTAISASLASEGSAPVASSSDHGQLARGKPYLRSNAPDSDRIQSEPTLESETMRVDSQQSVRSGDQPEPVPASGGEPGTGMAQDRHTEFARAAIVAGASQDPGSIPAAGSGYVAAGEGANGAGGNVLSSPRAGRQSAGVRRSPVPPNGSNPVNSPKSQGYEDVLGAYFKE